MIFAIFLISILLVSGGVLGLVSALNLIPTDLGLVHFQAGVTALVGGLITMALGFATRAIVVALRRLTSVRALAAEFDADLSRSRDPAGEVPLRGAHDGVQEPAEHIRAVHAPERLQEWPNPSPREYRPQAPMAAGALVAGAAIGAAAISIREAATAEPTRDAALDAFEQALMAEASDISHAASTPEPAQPMPSVSMPEALDINPADEPATEPEPAPLTMPTLAPMPEPPAFTLQAIPDPPALSIEQEIRAQLGHPPGAEPVVQPAESAPEPEAPPGLIADEDLATLEQSSPPLAPLDTLEVVGAYDSGGTRFAMYSDGSVVAAGPDGETRYPTLQDLRRHLDQSAG